MIKNIEALAERLKGIKVDGEDITPEKLIEMQTAEAEFEIEAPNVFLMDNEQLADLKSNLKKTAYEEGKGAGSEMFAKDLKRKFNIEAEGKTVDTLYKHVNSKVLADAGKEVEPKIRELETSLEALQKKYETDVSAKEDQLKGYEAKLKDASLTSMLVQQAPQGLTGIKPSQAVTLFKAEHQLDFDENGGVVIKKNGTVLKDDLEKPLNYNEVFNSYLKQNNWLGAEGRGGKDDPGGTSTEFKTVDDAFKHMEAKGIDPGSAQGQKLLESFTNKN